MSVFCFVFPLQLMPSEWWNNWVGQTEWISGNRRKISCFVRLSRLFTLVFIYRKTEGQPLLLVYGDQKGGLESFLKTSQIFDMPISPECGAKFSKVLPWQPWSLSAMCPFHFWNLSESKKTGFVHKISPFIFRASKPAVSGPRKLWPPGDPGGKGVNLWRTRRKPKATKWSWWCRPNHLLSYIKRKTCQTCVA